MFVRVNGVVWHGRQEEQGILSANYFYVEIAINQSYTLSFNPSQSSVSLMAATLPVTPINKFIIPLLLMNCSKHDSELLFVNFNQDSRCDDCNF